MLHTLSFFIDDDFAAVNINLDEGLPQLIKYFMNSGLELERSNIQQSHGAT